jgi:LEA14-like dessication related protein
MNRILAIVLAAALGACATLPGTEPLQVTVADIESMEGEGMEMRMLVKLRVQNPNESALEFDGVYIKVQVLDRTLATGVSDQRGVVPRFGETIVAVPLTVSTLRVALGALEVIGGTRTIDKVTYRMEGKLDGLGWGSHKFQHTGQLAIPTSGTPAGTKLTQ